MRVDVVEVGERPTAWTKARRFAPAGARVLGEVLGQMQFGDEAIVVLDWSNELGQMPDDVAKPILLLRVRKTFPGMSSPNTVDIDLRLDVDDVFGSDEITADSLRWIVQSMVEKMEESVKSRKEWKR